MGRVGPGAEPEASTAAEAREETSSPIPLVALPMRAVLVPHCFVLLIAVPLALLLVLEIVALQLTVIMFLARSLIPAERFVVGKRKDQRELKRAIVRQQTHVSPLVADAFRAGLVRPETLQPVRAVRRIVGALFVVVELVIQRLAVVRLAVVVVRRVGSKCVTDPKAQTAPVRHRTAIGRQDGRRAVRETDRPP